MASASTRTIVITGVGRGLGAEIAERFGERGDRVWGTVRAGRRGHADRMETAGMLAGVVEMDIGDEESVVAASAELRQRIDHVDVLINCAGLDARAFDVPADERGPFDVDANVFSEIMRINATGPMMVTRELLGLLGNAGAPLIVNISSQLGSMQVAATKGRDTAYCVSKAALNMWSVKAAVHLRAEGIGVVMVHPGWVQTDMGGPTAPLTPLESSTAIADTIDGLSLADSGRFLRWDGTDHPW